MLLVKTRVAPSAIHGLGLFAAAAIPAGTPVWRFQPGFDQAFTPEQFAALPADAQAHVRFYAYLCRDTARWVLSGDFACFMNHDAQPNTGAGPGLPGEPVTTVARRPIALGEEITCDYFAFDAEAKTKLHG